MRRGLFLALLVTFCGFSRAADAQGPPYTFTKVQVPGSVYTDATGINNSGQVVGTYYSADGKRHGYKFDGGTYTTIDFPGALHSFLFGIDVAGRTVGSYSLVSGNGPWHSFIADSGNFSSFDFPNKESDGRAINAGGRIVGIYNSGPGMPDTGYLKVDDSYETISVPGAQHTYALGINDAGRISGSYVGADGLLRGWVKVGGSFGTVTFPGATQTFIGGINNLDTMVGWSQKGVNPTHGFLASGTRLRAFDVSLPSAAGSYPQAVNDGGQIAGNYFSPDCPNGCGFLATPQVGGLPTCDQNLSLEYAGGTLKLKFAGLRT
jgi:probable HAF family extracellular repeat protein